MTSEWRSEICSLAVYSPRRFTNHTGWNDLEIAGRATPSEMTGRNCDVEIAQDRPTLSAHESSRVRHSGPGPRLAEAGAPHSLSLAPRARDQQRRMREHRAASAPLIGMQNFWISDLFLRDIILTYSYLSAIECVLANTLETQKSNLAAGATMRHVGRAEALPLILLLVLLQEISHRYRWRSPRSLVASRSIGIR